MLVSVAGGVGLIVLVACLFGFCATVAHKHRLWYQVLVWLQYSTSTGTRYCTSTLLTLGKPRLTEDQ